MHLALREVGVGPGDEVLVQSLTFVGSVTPVIYLGARPVFIDSDTATWNMDPALLETELAACDRRGKLPRAVVPTDVYGQSCDQDAIRAVCDRYGVPLIQDAAEAVGATYKGRPTGAGARAAVYSFNGNKVLTTAGGGMLASDDAALIGHACLLANQARDPAPHYEHSEIGYNYRLSNVLAAIGRGQLRSVADHVEKRRWLFRQYQQGLADVAGVTFMPEAPYGRSSRWLTAILIDAKAAGMTPESVRLALEEQSIEARPVWKPMHLQPVFAGCRSVGGAVSERLFRDGLCLPSGSAMSAADVERVVAVVRSCVQRGSP
jgi:pyridoxal phosphate-dependent aminotransferase EpsN